MSNIHVLNLSAYTSPVISETNRENWVDFLTEEGDQYFQFLIDRYSNSTTNNAIINNVARLIYKDRIFCTAQPLVTFSVNNNQYVSNSTTNDFIVYE